MTGDELLERASSRHLTEYQLLYQIRAEEAELREQGLTDEEIADSIEDGDYEPDPLEEGGLIDHLLGEEKAAARRHQLLQAELEDEEDEDDESD